MGVKMGRIGEGSRKEDAVQNSREGAQRIELTWRKFMSRSSSKSMEFLCRREVVSGSPGQEFVDQGPYNNSLLKLPGDYYLIQVARSHEGFQLCGIALLELI